MREIRAARVERARLLELVSQGEAREQELGLQLAEVVMQLGDLEG